MRVSDCIFLGNTASSGSALYVNGESASISIADSRFEANVADGEDDEHSQQHQQYSLDNVG